MRGKNIRKREGTKRWGILRGGNLKGEKGGKWKAKKDSELEQKGK